MNDTYFFDELEKNGVKISENQRKAITERVNGVLSYEPRIGVFGKTGAGKSSLCNALFGKEICEISDVKACTRNTKEVMLNLGQGQKGIKLIDVPGVGESSERDEEYAELYAKLLPELDLVLWLLKSDDRAFSSDENFYKNIVKPHIDQDKPFFFVLNQVDKIEPFREWDVDMHEPGPKQFQNIHRKVDDVAQFFGIGSSKIIPVSANEKYNLTKLVDEIVYALPKDKKVTFFKEVSNEFRSEAAGEHVKRSFIEVIGDTICDTIDAVGNVVEKIAEWGGKILEKLPLPPFLGGGGCYITTAVCEYYDKPDDCYELTQFRNFRDEWLVKQPDGPSLVQEYYNTAPTIVSKINSSTNRNEIYSVLFEKYLKPCLTFIENNKFIECKDLYVAMIHNLKAEFKI